VQSAGGGAGLNVTGNRQTSGPAAKCLLIGTYVAATGGPLLAAFLLAGIATGPLADRLGRTCALLALPILAMQPVLAARLGPLDRAFGLNAIYLFHKVMGIAAGSLLIAHPIILASSGQPPWALLAGFAWPWYINLAKVGLAALLVLIVTALLRRELRLRFEQWRRLHNVLAITVLTVGLVHSLNAGSDLEHWTMRGIWAALAIAAGTSYGLHKVIWPRRRRRRPFTVARVDRESHDTWTLRFVPPAGEPPLHYLPGQFQFLTFFGTKGLPNQEHPFTISSSPMATGWHSATVKESGDFTSLIGRVRPGDPVGIQAPFGHFSYVLHPQESHLVFIAGGVGITPFVSMLRHMRDNRADTSVVLVYASRHEQDILFRSELELIACGNKPRLTVIHILSAPDQGWTGEKGHIGTELLRRHVAPLDSGKVFYICGPPTMTVAVMADLVRSGVRSADIRTERFAL
jgi:predicted ferric reductase